MRHEGKKYVSAHDDVFLMMSSSCCVTVNEFVPEKSLHLLVQYSRIVSHATYRMCAMRIRLPRWESRGSPAWEQDFTPDAAAASSLVVEGVPSILPTPWHVPWRQVAEAGRGSV